MSESTSTFLMYAFVVGFAALGVAIVVENVKLQNKARSMGIDLRKLNRDARSEQGDIPQVFGGTQYSGTPALTRDGDQIYEGTQFSGTPLYTISGNEIFPGTRVSGTPLATIRGNEVYPGVMASGQPLGIVDGEHAFRGIYEDGTTPMATSPQRDALILAAMCVHGRRDK